MEGIFGNLAIGFTEVFKLQAITIAGMALTRHLVAIDGRHD